MPGVQIPASHRDIVEKSPIVVLATSGKDGFPQASAVWFVADEDGTVNVSLNSSRQKLKNLQRHPEASLLFVDPENPYRTVELRSRAEIAADPTGALAERVAAKYGSDPRGFDQPGEQRFAVRFVPLKANVFG